MELQHLTVEVTLAHVGKRLDRFLVDQPWAVSRSQIKASIARGLSLSLPPSHIPSDPTHKPNGAGRGN